MNKIRDFLPGLIPVLLIGLASWYLAEFIPYLNGIILGLLLGLILGNLIGSRPNLESGIKLSSGKGLELAIVFLAFSIDYKSLTSIGWQSLLWLTLSLGLVLFLAKLLSKTFRCPGQSGTLIAFGTAICGSSAIAALSPQIEADKKDTAMAMAVVNLLGTSFMLTLPLLLGVLDIQELSAAFILGGSLHAVGNVAGAGFAMGSVIGELAITIKLARVALLTPALFFMHAISDKQADVKTGFKLPWYILAFLAITILNSTLTLPVEFLESMKFTGELLLTLAMTAMGWKIRFRDLMDSGKKGLTFGLVIFAIQLLLLASGLLIFL